MRLAWSTERVPGLALKLQRNPVSKNKKPKQNKKRFWLVLMLNTFKPFILAFGRQRQVTLCGFKARLVYKEFKDSQGYMVRPCLNKIK